MGVMIVVLRSDIVALCARSVCEFCEVGMHCVLS